MSIYKVLKIPDLMLALKNFVCYSMEEILEDFGEEYDKRKSQFAGRDGFYFNRLDNLSWIEYEGSAYFLSNNKLFLETLQDLSIVPMRDCEFKLLQQMDVHKLITKEQMAMLTCECNRRQYRATYVGASLVNMHNL